MFIYLGYLMIVAPFVLLFYFICKNDGLKAALMVFGCCASLVGWIVTAIDFIV